MKIMQIESSEEKSQICEKILRSLPDWFGIESAIVNYVEEVKEMETWVARDEEILGFLSLNKHNPYTAEIHVMGFLPQHHRKNGGSKLLLQAEKSLSQQGFKFLTVKTLSPARPDIHYDKTRQFYLKSGFTPLEEFKTLWGEHNPCLMLAKVLSAENYAVIFSSQRNENDKEGYESAATRMLELAKTQPGFIDVESARDSNGAGITISYWRTLQDIKSWKLNAQHLEIQEMGRSQWYKSYTTRICKVERTYQFPP